MSAVDSDSELLSKLSYGNPHKRVRFHIYTVEEPCRLMEQCNYFYFPDGVHALIMKTAIGLLWATGLRTSELVNLTISDVDFINNLLNIRSSKLNKDRVVSLLSEVSSQLKIYRNQVELRCNKILENNFL